MKIGDKVIVKNCRGMVKEFIGKTGSVVREVKSEENVISMKDMSKWCVEFDTPAIVAGVRFWTCDGFRQHELEVRNPYMVLMESVHNPAARHTVPVYAPDVLEAMGKAFDSVDENEYRVVSAEEYAF
jgi:hypothetical protein